MTEETALNEMHPAAAAAPTVPFDLEDDPFAELFADLDGNKGDQDVGTGTDSKSEWGWKLAHGAIGVMASALALGGMVFSFHSVSTEMAQVPSIGPHWANLVPLIADGAIFTFSGADIALQRANIQTPLPRWFVYASTISTVAMNLAADSADSHLSALLRSGAIVAHVIGPAAWVAFVETLRTAVRTKVLKATNSRRQPIPFTRWITSPVPTLKLWRRMVLWRENDYRKALHRELLRLAAFAIARRGLGFGWRWRIAPDLRLRMTLGLVGLKAVRAAVGGEGGHGSARHARLSDTGYAGWATDADSRTRGADSDSRRGLGLADSDSRTRTTDSRTRGADSDSRTRTTDVDSRTTDSRTHADSRTRTTDSDADSRTTDSRTLADSRLAQVVALGATDSGRGRETADPSPRTTDAKPPWTDATASIAREIVSTWNAEGRRFNSGDFFAKLRERNGSVANSSRWALYRYAIASAEQHDEAETA